MGEHTLLDWEQARIIEGIAGPILDVSGKTETPMEVSLHCAPVGTVAWEYWPIELQGAPPNVSTEVETTFHLDHDLAKCRGTKGVELIGASKTEKFDL